MKTSQFFSLALTAAVLLATPPSNAAEPPDTAGAAYQRKDYATAYQLAQIAAQAGDANAQYVLGMQLRRGLGVARNDAEAARWLASAAEQNHADATNELAAMHRLGEGVSRDDRRAFALSMKAAELGDATALYDIGQAYRQGAGVTKDMLRARYWLERADAVEAAVSWAAIPRENRPGSGTLQAIPSECKPKQPPRLAMRKSDVDVVTGTVSAIIDSEGRIRGVTERDLSTDALKYDIVALFSAALRSNYCVFPAEARNLKLEMPFKFELTDNPSVRRR